MDMGICAIITDFRGRLLLQQPTGDTLCPPHGPWLPGRLPSDTLGFLVRAQTGLIVWPVRLTGLYYRAGALTFCWRCTMRGGDLPPPQGQPPAGFFDSAPRPAGLARPWQRPVDEALHHAGGPPVLRAETDAATRLGKLLGRAPAAVAPWAVAVAVWAEVEPGRGLWRQDAAGHLRLPWATATAEAPWATAERLLPSLAPGVSWAAPRLALVQLAADQPAMTLVFATTMIAESFQPAASLVVAAADDPTMTLDPADRDMAMALDPTGEAPPFRLFPGQGANGNG